MTSLSPAPPVTAGDGRVYGRYSAAAPPQGLSRALAVSVTLASALVFYGVVTHGSFSPIYERPELWFDSRFFLAQAQALVHGNLYVARAQLPGECWIHHGRCYGYFGLTPSILRLPFLPLLDATNRSFTPVFLTGALALAVGSALAIASLMFPPVNRTPLVSFFVVALVLTLGPASVLATVARPAVYEEAIAWSVGFGLLGIYAFLRWWSTQRSKWAVLLVLSLTLSTNARPTTLALALALGVGVAARALASRRARHLTSLLILATAVVVVPVVSCLAVYWLKFHSLMPSELLNESITGPSALPEWLAIRRVDHNSLQGLRFVPSSLLAYLRPDGFGLSSAFPFVRFRFGPGGVPWLGVPRGSMSVHPFSTLPDAMPLAVGAVIIGLGCSLRRRGKSSRASARAFTQPLRCPVTYCVLGAAGSCVITLRQGVINYRYLADAFPLVVLVLLIALRPVIPRAAQLSGRRAVAAIIAVTFLLAWGLVVNLGLEYQSWWHQFID